MNNACLVLENGRVFEGTSFGGVPRTPAMLSPGQDGVGEVIFNTSMTGYTEVLTDPSYTGQMLVMTYPHIGNYGVDTKWSEHSSYEKKVIQASGFIVRSYYRGPLPKGRMPLHEFLSVHGVPGIEGIDTRALTLHIREEGAQRGVIVAAMQEELQSSLPDIRAFLESLPEMMGRNLVSEVGSEEIVEHCEGSPTVALLDCGVKRGIVRNLEERGAGIILLPSTVQADEILRLDADMLLLSNGPGDPSALPHIVPVIAKLAGRIPIRGICLGHQLIATALGAATYKMPFGHHGGNHAIRDEFSRKIYVCSENHGFAVDEDNFSEGLEVWFRNSSDGTVEGLRDTVRDILSVQFHPEAGPGPVDTEWIFDVFLDVSA